MRVRHADHRLERLERDAEYRAGFGGDVTKAFRKKMQLIRDAVDERDFYCLKSLHYEKLKGWRQNQRSMRLNSQWRLILEIRSEDDGKTVVVVGIEDYH